MEAIINRVANSPLISIDLEEYYPRGERVLYDLKDNLFQGMVLREKDFRTFVKSHDWDRYKGRYVAITCTADAIVPTWAYMLLASKIEPVAKEVIFGNMQSLEEHLMKSELDKIDPQGFKDAKVVIKGCGDLPITAFAFVELTKKLRPVVSSLMFGEPCSSVPIYKKSKK